MAFEDKSGAGPRKRKPVSNDETLRFPWSPGSSHPPCERPLERRRERVALDRRVKRGETDHIAFFESNLLTTPHWGLGEKWVAVRFRGKFQQVLNGASCIQARAALLYNENLKRLAHPQECSARSTLMPLSLRDSSPRCALERQQLPGAIILTSLVFSYDSFSLLLWRPGGTPFRCDRRFG